MSAATVSTPCVRFSDDPTPIGPPRGSASLPLRAPSTPAAQLGPRRPPPSAAPLSLAVRDAPLRLPGRWCCPAPARGLGLHGPCWTLWRPGARLQSPTSGSSPGPGLDMPRAVRMAPSPPSPQKPTRCRHHRLGGQLPCRLIISKAGQFTSPLNVRVSPFLSCTSGMPHSPAPPRPLSPLSALTSPPQPISMPPGSPSPSPDPRRHSGTAHRPPGAPPALAPFQCVLHTAARGRLKTRVPLPKAP